jgi:hypothetical protein
MEIEGWLPVADLVLFSVDVVDHKYNITTSGTYFIHDWQIVSTSYSGITDGYKFYYYPLTISGAVSLTIHAENSNSETKEESYYLLYGYNVKFNEIVDWGYKSTVVITADARNLAFCPNTKTDAFFFETADLHSRDLNAALQAVEYVDLNATIYPQSTFFFYGRTYTVKIENVKDFAGNIMSDFNFSFTIENPNN